MTDAEPVPPGALDEPPDWLSDEQKDAWRYALANAPAGLLRRLDRSVLTVWVCAVDAHRRAAIMLQRSRTLLMRQNAGRDADGNEIGVGTPFPSLYLGIMNKQAQIIIRAVAELGFSPVSRARVYQAVAMAAPGLPALPGPKGGEVITLEAYIANAPPRPRMN